MSWLGQERVTLAICDSTNDEAARLARAGAATGTVVIAAAQRAGRGRMGRSWHSPAGENLYLSCILRPPLDAVAVPPLTLAAGIAVAEAVNTLGLAAFLKWPNDVVLAAFAPPRKVAGILTEMSAQGQKVEQVILGIGVNLETRRFPPELAGLAASVRQACPSLPPIDQGAFVDDLLCRLADWIDRYVEGGVAAIRGAWLARASAHPVQVEHRGRRVQGRPVGLGTGGELLVETSAGERIAVSAGEVRHAPISAGPGGAA